MNQPIGPQVTPTEWVPRLASLVHTIRADWDESGIASTLRKVSDRPLALVALAAITCATERADQRTPACIALDGHHWHATTATTAPAVVTRYCETHGRPFLHECRYCRDGQTVEPRGGPPPPDVRAQMRADLAAAQDRPDIPDPRRTA